jgi:nicotinamidase-related amidase
VLGSLDQQAELPLEHDVDLLLALMGVDAAALTRLEHDQVHAERAHTEITPKGLEALIDVTIERGERDVRLSHRSHSTRVGELVGEPHRELRVDQEPPDHALSVPSRDGVSARTRPSHSALPINSRGVLVSVTVSDSHTDPDFAASALITIDTQRDVLDGGALEIPGTSAALDAIRLLARAFRDAGRPIVHIVRLYLQDASNVDLCRRAAVAGGMPGLRAGSSGSQLADGLAGPDLELDPELLLAGEVQPLGRDEVAIYKPRWGAFYATSLEDHLRELGVDTLVFCGANFPNCPRTSIYQASERDFRVVAVRDAISGLYERGERELANIGVRLLDGAEVACALESGRASKSGPGVLA